MRYKLTCKLALKAVPPEVLVVQPFVTGEVNGVA